MMVIWAFIITFNLFTGLIYGYNPEICPDRSEVNAEVMIGGDLVQAVVDAPMMEY